MKIGESKNAAFKRLALRRTNNLINDIRLLGNLSNKRNYTYSEDDFKRIFNTVENEMKLAKSKFLVSMNGKKRFRL